MSYSSARSHAQNAINESTDYAIQELAEAIRTLARTAEQDIAKLERQIKEIKSRR
jgi:hypothetical protein